MLLVPLGEEQNILKVKKMKYYSIAGSYSGGRNGKLPLYFIVKFPPDFQKGNKKGEKRAK